MNVCKKINEKLINKHETKHKPHSFIYKQKCHFLTLKILVKHTYTCHIKTIAEVLEQLRDDMAFKLF